MPATIDQIIASRKALYDPQRQLIQQQVDQLPGQEQADVAGLDTAKTNAFGDINIQANDRGLSYSGMPIAEQSRYVGERYLPALAQTKANYADRRTKLQQGLLGINADEMTSAQQLQQEQVKAEQEAQARAEQLALEREKMASAERAAASRATTSSKKAAASKAKVVTDPSGGFQFYGEQGQKVTAAQYVSGQGGNFQDLVGLLSQSKNGGDAQIIRDMQSGMSPAALAKKYPWVFGGV